MPELEIHTTGGGYYLYDIFNYLAAFTGSGNFETLIYTAITAGLMIASLQMVIFGSVRQAFTYFIGALIVVAIGIGPKAKVIVMDSTEPTGIYGIVDNVPWSVAFVGSLSSRAGFSITKQMETLLAAPDDLTYQRSGMMFGSTIMSQAARWRAVTPIIQENLVNFMENCMVDGSNIGIVDTKGMGYTGDLESFISSNVPNSLAYYDPVLEETKTCVEGWPLIQDRMTAEVQTVLNQKAAAQFANSGTATLTNSVNKMTGTLGEFQNFVGMASSSATETIRQTMLIISMDDAIQRLIASSGNNAAMTAYQAARTEAQTSASYSAVGISALKWVPLLKIVFESLYYAAFPLAMLMMLTPMVWGVMKGYFGGFVWLAAWDPLSAILHSIVMKASSGYYREAMGSYSDGAMSYSMSFANHLGVRAVEQDVGTIAGYLMMSVPFVATVILFGAGRVAGLATSMLNVSQGAAVESGREAATGNLSLANASMNNFTANKTNTSSLRDIGAATERMVNGAMRTVNADGSSTFATGTAQTTGGMSARVGQTIREEISDRKDAAIRTAKSSRDEWASSVSDVASNYANFGQSLSSGTSTAIDNSTAAGSRKAQEARAAHQKVETFAKEHNISTDAAYALAIAGKAESSKGIGKLSPLSASAGADIGLKGVDSDRFGELVTAARESGLTETVSSYGEAVRSIRSSSQTSQGASQDSGERWSTDEVQRKAETYAEAVEEAETLSQAESKLYSQGLSYDGQLTDAIVNEWREAGYDDSQISGFLNPKTTAGVRAQERAVESVLPALLSELDLNRPAHEMADAYQLKKPEQPIIEQRLPDTGADHQKRHEVFSRTSGEQHKEMKAETSQRQGEIRQEADKTQAAIGLRQTAGVAGNMVSKLVPFGDNLADAAADMIAGWTTSGSGSRGTQSSQTPSAQPLTTYDRDMMIRTIYGEAARESEAGQAAVAHVIMNRVADPRWGDNPAEVSLQLKQFSAWNSGVGRNSLPTDLKEGSADYKRIGAIVDQVHSGQITDPTGGATHYYSPAGMDAHVARGEQSHSVPTWLATQSNARGGENVQIGGHIFTGRRRDE
ncbi:conjugal transfer protein TraG N-terminal domain-containing protein [Shimia sp. FJ5]|uniref:conjugal transfer protein TraG N-terminal domain-containing protein n=1 Tax=Shimia sp. FJ5 TaxID=3079054 RepID=UPI00293DC7FD|nr:conjugal transfer protein TraG N-terminal domain-containing protein [Shimia sp. FJ5]MDV4146453.1 conjugal transfer protein TraG N-terminal domain-containing protein [Shimia sp. FJ5]